MSHDISSAASREPCRAWVGGDKKNAYNSVDRVFAYEEAVAASALLAEATAAQYAEPTQYVQ